uniref:Uncharacterized protein n=1 Tax=Nelumbo nucifera TaxID=4432 RepID=A0A822ZKC3_NELNU|nr:TPA_asm: hypothetical protein HUJ06_002271 [Nelumbo nucifera]
MIKAFAVGVVLETGFTHLHPDAFELLTSPWLEGKAFRYKIAAVEPILAASTIGVSIPVLGKAIPVLHPERNIFFMIKAFAADVILATGFTHLHLDAFDLLTSPWLEGKAWELPFTGFVAKMIDTSATGYYKRSHFNKSHPLNGYEERTGEHVGSRPCSHPCHTWSCPWLRFYLLRVSETSTHLTGFGVGNCGTLCDHWDFLGDFGRPFNNKTFGCSSDFPSVL